MLILGIDVSRKSEVFGQSFKSIHEAISTQTTDLGINAVQFYTHGPRTLAPNNVEPTEVKRATSDIYLVSHSTYLDVAIWNKTNKKWSLYYDSIAEQVRTLKECGGSGLVLHISRIKPAIVAKIMVELEPIFYKSSICLFLEMTASKSHPELTYETPEKINRLDTLIRKELKSAKKTSMRWWKFCIDTCHIWCAGFNNSAYADMRAWLDNILSKDMIGLFHLNGAYNLCGSGKDKHAIPMSRNDKIWGKMKIKDTGLCAVVEFAVENKVPLICEINCGERADAIESLEKIKELGGPSA